MASKLDEIYEAVQNSTFQTLSMRLPLAIRLANTVLDPIVDLVETMADELAYVHSVVGQVVNMRYWNSEDLHLRVGVLGVGKLGGMIVDRLAFRRDKDPMPSNLDIYAFSRSMDKLSSSSSFNGVHVVKSAGELVKTSDLLVIAVPPAQLRPLLEDIRASLPPHLVVICLCAGVSAERVQNYLRRKDAPALVVTPSLWTIPQLLALLPPQEQMQGMQPPSQNPATSPGGPHTSRRDAATVFMEKSVNRRKFEWMTAFHKSVAKYLTRKPLDSSEMRVIVEHVADHLKKWTAHLHSISST